MRIACLYLPALAVQVERRTTPELAGRPVVIGGYHHETGRVREISEEAAAYGVARDMLLRQAYQLCPSGAFLPYREEGCGEAFSSVLSEAAQRCPLVEPEPPAHVLLGLRFERDERSFMEEVLAAVERRLGFNSSCGIASSRFIARIAAEDAGMSRLLVLEDGEEREFLHGLPVERLPLSEATRRRLRLLGITRAGNLLDLPSGALEAQFGGEGRSLLAVLRGEDNREVAQWQGACELVRAMGFDVPVAHGDELLHEAHGLLAALCRGLQSQWQCSRRLDVTLVLEGGEVKRKELHFKEPSSSLDALWRRLKPCIGDMVGAAPVEELHLAASELCAGEGMQASFLDGRPRASGRFDEAIGVLQQRYGRDVVKKVVSRRGGRLPEERFTFVPCEVE